MATAVVVTLGVPVLAVVQPGARANHEQAPDARPTVVADAPEAATVGTAVGMTPNEAARRSEALIVPASAAATLGTEILRLSDQADSVDRLWAAYGEQCGARQSERTQPNDFGRGWFSVLDGAEPTAGAYCSELFQLVRQSGEGIRRDLRRALSAARKARVDTGTEVGLLRWHSLELP